MGKKKLQGADGINFQMQLTIKGLETVTFPKETLTNESGKDIAWIECLGGKVSAYVNLPHAVRPNNIQPFQLSDCIQIDLISDKVIEYMKAYLKKHMKGVFTNAGRTHISRHYIEAQTQNGNTGLQYAD